MRLYRLNKVIEAKTKTKGGGTALNVTLTKVRNEVKGKEKATAAGIGKGRKRKIPENNVPENEQDELGEKASEHESDDFCETNNKRLKLEATMPEVEGDNADGSDENTNEECN